MTFSFNDQKQGTRTGDSDYDYQILEDLLHWNEEEEALDAEYEPFRDQLSLAGLSEEELRKMDPDDRVAALEKAILTPTVSFILPAETKAIYNRRAVG